MNTENGYRFNNNRNKPTGSKLRNTVQRSIPKLNSIKSRLVSRLFWGRSSYYKNLTHIFMIVASSIIVLTGFTHRLSLSANRTSLTNDGIIVGTTDLLLQGGSLETVKTSDLPVQGLVTTEHVVQDGETLETIANQYNVTADTIRWANKDKSTDLSFFLTDRVAVGTDLSIPQINGVLYTVKRGETLEGIIANAALTNNEANRFNIVEFNNLKAPYTLTEGQTIFIPDGNLNSNALSSTLSLPRDVFANPLSNPDCNGYSISRGFLSYHNGIDLARWPGCPISAVANGTVTYAGWLNAGEGYNVRIDHGGGIVTQYFHGSGEFYVKAGDKVRQGQPIMMMGTTGNSTGVHLHFILWFNGIAIDPYGYVPY
jgi:murein DD-endopeptidase MepM/ murein hydrolase activator NlpD